MVRSRNLCFNQFLDIFYRFFGTLLDRNPDKLLERPHEHVETKQLEGKGNTACRCRAGCFKNIITAIGVGYPLEANALARLKSHDLECRLRA